MLLFRIEAMTRWVGSDEHLKRRIRQYECPSRWSGLAFPRLQPLAEVRELEGAGMTASMTQRMVFLPRSDSVLWRQFILKILERAVACTASSVCLSLIIPLGLPRKCYCYLFLLVLPWFSLIVTFLSFSLVVEFSRSSPYSAVRFIGVTVVMVHDGFTWYAFLKLVDILRVRAPFAVIDSKGVVGKGRRGIGAPWPQALTDWISRCSPG